MTYAITQTCCKDASCVSVCPVNCIHPTPGEPGFATADMLFVDPKACIDCGACADACPVDAIVPVDLLGPREQVYADWNAAHFAPTGDLAVLADHGEVTGRATQEKPTFRSWDAPTFDWSLPSDFTPLRVAVVGTGPAGMYAAEQLVLHTPSTVTLVDRLPVAGGLVRFGVAPDHPSTKKVGETFARLHRHPRVRLALGLEVGRDLTPEELAEHFDAVVYAVGASDDRRLGIPGEELAGSLSAREVVGWYNGHPDIAPDHVDLSGERAVVVGTGNVALDIARVLTGSPEALAPTQIARHAVEALRRRGLREVVLTARRGPGEAAYTSPELLALRHLDGVELVVDAHSEPITSAIAAGAPHGYADKAGLLAGVRQERVDYSVPPPPGLRIVLRFETTPTGLLGEDRVTALQAADVTIPTGLVVRSVGYRGAALPGLPFDEVTGTVPNVGGRVEAVPGTYVVGWIKRGPSGGIGTNRFDAEETVRSLLDDAVADRLPVPRRSARSFGRLARSRGRT